MSKYEQLKNSLRGHPPTHSTLDPLRAADAIDELEAENAKLREALKPLAGMPLWTDAYPDGPLSVGDNRYYVDPQWIVAARAALENKP